MPPRERLADTDLSMPRVKLTFQGGRPKVDLQLGLGLRPQLERWQARLRPRRPSEELLEVREISALMARPAAVTIPFDGSPDGPLRISFVVPAPYPNSVYHTMIGHLVRGLERHGHRVSIWIDDVDGNHRNDRRAPRQLKRWFGPFDAVVNWGTSSWSGADVAIALTWRGVYRVRTLGDTSVRVYMADDDEVSSYATSYQRAWAQEARRQGFFPIASGPWLAGELAIASGLPATSFEPGVDPAVYNESVPQRRATDTVVFVGSGSGVPVILAALTELRRRRPQTEFWSVQEHEPHDTDLAIRHLGLLSDDELRPIYSTATVGLTLSMTNRAPKLLEMAACGLPSVELATPSAVASFGIDGGVELVELEPFAIADALERLLDDEELRTRRLASARRTANDRTWEAAAESLETGLRAALRHREGESA